MSLDLLKYLEYDENGNLVPKLGNNLECGPNGIRYTGARFTPKYQGLGCVEELCDQQSDLGYNSAIKTNIFGEMHAPPVGCLFQSPFSTTGNAGGVDLGAGSGINIPILNGVGITLPSAACFPARIRVFSSATVLLVMPGTHHHAVLDLSGNGVPSLAQEELNYTSPGATSQVDMNITGRCFDAGILEPGQTTFFTVQMIVTNGGESSNTMGVFGWHSQHYIIHTSLEDV